MLISITSTFKTIKNNIVEVRIFVKEYTSIANRIYDLEILPEEQEPPWEGVDVTKPPKNWTKASMGKGVRLSSSSPIPVREPFTFELKIDAITISDTIRIHATDKNHRNLGFIISRRVG